MKTVLSELSAAAALLALVMVPIPANGQDKAAPKYVAPRTADGHPDMQGAWARRGVPKPMLPVARSFPR